MFAFLISNGMNFLKLIQSKIISFELRLRYAIKSLSLSLKIAFLALIILLIVGLTAFLRQLDKELSVEVPKRGGVIREGVIGTPRFVNPVLAISDADRDTAMLVYSGLMRVGEDDRLMPDLAESYEISDDGLCYKFALKPDLKWSDGEPITTDDIIFTIEQIKNRLVQSPKRASWEGVEMKKINERNINFCLPKSYAPFLENTVTGILPKHTWQDILPEQMPLSDFNIKPAGSGPYKIKKISKNSAGIITSYTLEVNENFCLEKPFIETIILKFYPSEKKLLEAYKNGEIENLSAVSPQNVLTAGKENSFLKTYNLPRVFGVFFNQTNAPLLTDGVLRKALNLAVDKERIIKEVLKGFGTALNGPIPPGSMGAINETGEKSIHESNVENAKELLKKSGWSLNSEEEILEKTSKNNQGKKETVKLELSLATSNSQELVQTANLIKEMWEKIGVKTQIKNYETGDLEQNVIRPRKYDSLLFGEVMGRDPDPFAFWHSSQRNDPGLNIALYANIAADKLLEEARTLSDQEKKEEKYRKFQEEILKDNAAIFLYSPSFIYLLPNNIKGVAGNTIITPSERFANIYKWHINTEQVWKIFD